MAGTVSGIALVAGCAVLFAASCLLAIRLWRASAGRSRGAGCDA